MSSAHIIGIIFSQSSVDPVPAFTVISDWRKIWAAGTCVSLTRRSAEELTPDGQVCFAIVFEILHCRFSDLRTFRPGALSAQERLL
jgi:hypothetical protein